MADVAGHYNPNELSDGTCQYGDNTPLAWLSPYEHAESYSDIP